MAIYSGNGIGKFLVEEGAAPKYSRNVELHIPMEGAAFLRYEVLVTDQDTRKIQKALEKLHEEDKQRADAQVLVTG